MHASRWPLVVMVVVLFAGSASATVVIKGKVEYWDQLAKDYMPAKGVHVEVEGDWWEPDIDLPTDGNGDYEAHQRDPIWGDFDDVDIEVYAETPGVIQVFEAWFSWYPYHAISAAVDDVGAGETVTIDVKIGGKLNNIEAYYRTPDETANAFVVHQEMLDHYRTLRQMGFPKEDFDETEVIIPAVFGEKYYNPITGFINLGVGGFFGADNWANLSPSGAGWITYNGFLTTVRHEYSHAIHDEITGFLPPLGFYPDRHSPGDESSSRWLAYTEGFAEFLPCATLNIGGRFEPTPTVVTPKSAELWITELPTENPYQDHYSWEGEVCAVLWDLFDPANQEEHLRRPAEQTVDGYSVPWQIVHEQTWVDRITDPNLQAIRAAVCTKTGVFSGPVDTIQEFLGFWSWAHQDQRHALRAIAYNRCISTGLPPEWPPVIIGEPTISRDMGTLTLNVSVQEKNPEDRPFLRLRAWHQVGGGEPVLVSDTIHDSGWQGDRNDIILTIQNVPFGTGESDVIWLVASDEMAPVAYRLVNPPSVVQMQPIPMTVIGAQGGTLLLERLAEASMPKVEYAAPLDDETTHAAGASGFLLQNGVLLAPVAPNEDAAKAGDAVRQVRELIAETRGGLRAQAERTELQERTARLVQRLTEHGEAGREGEGRAPLLERQKLLRRAADEEDRFAGGAEDLAKRLGDALGEAMRGPLPQGGLQATGKVVSDLQDALRKASDTRPTTRPDATPGPEGPPDLTAVSESFEGDPDPNWRMSGACAVTTAPGGGRALVFTGPGYALWFTERAARPDLRLRLRYRPGGGAAEVYLCNRGESPEILLYKLRFDPPAVVLIRYQRDEQQMLASVNRTLPPSQWHDVTVEIRAGRLRVQINGEQVLDATDPRPLPRGVIGFGCTAGSAAFDVVVVTPLAPEDP